MGGSAAGWVVVEQPAHQLMLLLPVAPGPSLSPLCPRHIAGLLKPGHEGVLGVWVL